MKRGLVLITSGIALVLGTLWLGTYLYQFLNESREWMRFPFVATCATGFCVGLFVLAAGCFRLSDSSHG